MIERERATVPPASWLVMDKLASKANGKSAISLLEQKESAAVVVVVVAVAVGVHSRCWWVRTIQG